MNETNKYFKDLLRQLTFNSDGRLRSGWRFLIFLISFSVVSTFLGAGVLVGLSNLPIGFDDKSLLFLVVVNLLSFLCALIIGWLCGKFLEGLPLRALGWTFSNQWLKHLVFGLAAGTFAILLAGAIAFAFGGLRFQFNNTAGSSAIGLTLAVSLVIFIVGAASEETIFRGYMLQTFSRAHLAWFAIALTSITFASAHLGNPNVNWISSLNTGLAGILFGAAYLKTRTLWFPFGLHLTWNWVQGAFLGITVSGLKELTTAPLLQPIDSGPVWLTGGEYGIEGGVACTIALAATTLLIWFSPILKPTEEMMALTDRENSKALVLPESSES
jgi:membrane protease YdiL (CAAX protease family)